MSEVKLSAVTHPLDSMMTPEQFMIWCARVSSPNQDNPYYEGLLRYCIKEKHWSVFEPVFMTVEITTTRAIAPQILRHRSFSFLEFSLRYANALGYEPTEARRQDNKNRQNSVDDLPENIKSGFMKAQQSVWNFAYSEYEMALENGIAKECARSVLPLNTITRLYMTGSVRNWIHYLRVRTAPDTQKEHRDIANAIKGIFAEQFPVTHEAVWGNHD